MASKRDRQRRLARERHERRMARAAERQRRNRTITKWTTIGLIAIAVIAVGAFTVTKLTANKKTPASASGSPTATSSTVPPRECAYTKTGNASRKVSLPPAKPDLTAKYTATIKTSLGDIVINLNNSQAPCTVNSLVSLAGQGYFNGTHCHRLTTSGIYVLQCGDPTGTGSGGPGYQFADENLKGATYKTGTVAMANAGPGTNGSQFFLVYKDSTLAPSYTPFGTIVSGLNIIQNVAQAGTTNSTGDGPPKQQVQIQSVTISKT